MVARWSNFIHEIGVGTQSWSLRSVRRGAGLIPPCGLAHNNLIPARGPVVGMCSDHIGPLPGFPGSPGFITPTCHRQVVDQTETIARLRVVEDWEFFVLGAPTVFDEDGVGESPSSSVVMSLELFQGRWIVQWTSLLANFSKVAFGSGLVKMSASCS